eukprot:TRINITY_DN1700_c0_g1_i1.p1 TRINITY_DN1700_c0_g1~~TRINITY_DN1700_c0_g1_i1.p1  ORF type:complete len:864 (-),score=215.54 TRINITY_DN1700_c0_g1_i1:214-2805(-)
MNFFLVSLLFVLCSAHNVEELSDWSITGAQGTVNVDRTGTVMASLVLAGVYKDPFFGTNLQKIDSKLFVNPYIYETYFSTPVCAHCSNPHHYLLIKGLNYRANVWINDVQIGAMKDIVGPFRYFELDLTTHLLPPPADNHLKLEIKPQVNGVWLTNSTDLGITFVDWNPNPPDENLGLWREVEVRTIADTVSIDYPLVRTALLPEHGTSFTGAQLTVMTEVHNWGNMSVSGQLVAMIDGVGTLTQLVTLKANEIKQIFFLPKDYALLTISNPRIWWPWQMGSAELYTLKMQFTVQPSSSISDELSVRFGVREMSDQLTDKQYRQYFVNRKPILIRGAGYSPDLFLISETNSTWQKQVLEYVKHMNLNTVRLEGKFPSDVFFDMADEMGLLIIPGFCCCDAWQRWPIWKAEQHTVASDSTRWQVKRLRIHASMLSFFYSSDELPPVEVEKEFLAAFQQEQWPNTLCAAASARTSTITGKTGVKMSGPYSWEPPNYWLEDTSKAGGAFGFLTEGGPGEAPLTSEAFEATLNPSSLWPENDEWNYHCGHQHGQFGSLKWFDPVLTARYGTPSSLIDYTKKAQAAIYESHRAMFEGYSHNKYFSTGVIQWMLNNAFPELIWHLFDFYFTPGGSYFGTQRACEPLHIQFHSHNRNISIINSYYSASPEGMVAHADVFNIAGTRIWSQVTAPLSALAADGVRDLFTLPPDSQLSDLSTTYFLRLTLYESATEERVLSRNVYWLSTKLDVLNWSKWEWNRTPCSSFADFSQLATLPQVQLDISSKTEQVGDQYRTTVTLHNSNKTPAFFVRLRMLTSAAQKQREVLPIFWSDNFVTLFADESLTLTAEYTVQAAGGDKPQLLVEPYNNLA